ncbi:MAG: hypothetical protein ACC661_01670 [Verrucomicrobiales bacterium]
MLNAKLIVLEDSLNGLRAATAAGMRCVVVPNPITSGLDFEGAWMQLESLVELNLVELV